VVRDGRVDQASCLAAHPGFEDGGIGASLRTDPMDDELVVERDDIGAADAGHGRDHADPMQSAAERDTAPIPGTTARCDPSGDLGLLPEVLPEPRL